MNITESKINLLSITYKTSPNNIISLFEDIKENYPPELTNNFIDLLIINKDNLELKELKILLTNYINLINAYTKRKEEQRIITLIENTIDSLPITINLNCFKIFKEMTFYLCTQKNYIDLDELFIIFSKKYNYKKKNLQRNIYTIINKIRKEITIHQSKNNIAKFLTIKKEDFTQKKFLYTLKNYIKMLSITTKQDPITKEEKLEYFIRLTATNLHIPNHLETYDIFIDIITFLCTTKENIDLKFILIHFSNKYKISPRSLASNLKNLIDTSKNYIIKNNIYNNATTHILPDNNYYKLKKFLYSFRDYINILEKNELNFPSRKQNQQSNYNILIPKVMFYLGMNPSNENFYILKELVSIITFIGPNKANNMSYNDLYNKVLNNEQFNQKTITKILNSKQKITTKINSLIKDSITTITNTNTTNDAIEYIYHIKNAYTPKECAFTIAEYVIKLEKEQTKALNILKKTY